MIHKSPPENFNPKFEVVSCFLEHNGEILLLYRKEEKSEGNKWGVPAGKIDDGECEFTAMARELREETGITAHRDDLKYLNKIYVRYPDYDFVYYMFCFQLEERPFINIRKSEHETFCWVSPNRALEMNLVSGQDMCIEMVYGS